MSRGRLRGDKARPGAEVAAARKAPDVRTRNGCNGRGGQHADTRDRREQLACLASTVPTAQLIAELGEHRTRLATQLERLADESAEVVFEGDVATMRALPRTSGHHDTESVR